MAVSLTKENFVLHKIHSLTGIIPVGYYLAQHLLLNSFSIAGPDKFNAVIDFFEGIPKYLLLILEICAIWLPLAFHAVYGIFIVDRSKGNYFSKTYHWSQNRMYTLQRYTGLFLFAFLIYHVLSTTGEKYYYHDASLVKFDAWHAKLLSLHGLIFVFYILGIITASYHLCYGLWNFCIRWGITVSDKAQAQVQKFSFVSFIALTILGWAALAGFLLPHGNNNDVQSQPAGQTAATMLLAR